MPILNKVDFGCWFKFRLLIFAQIQIENVLMINGALNTFQLPKKEVINK